MESNVNKNSVLSPQLAKTFDVEPLGQSRHWLVDKSLSSRVKIPLSDQGSLCNSFSRHQFFSMTGSFFVSINCWIFLQSVLVYDRNVPFKLPQVHFRRLDLVNFFNFSKIIEKDTLVRNANNNLAQRTKTLLLFWTVSFVIKNFERLPINKQIRNYLFFRVYVIAYWRLIAEREICVIPSKRTFGPARRTIKIIDSYTSMVVEPLHTPRLCYRWFFTDWPATRFRRLSQNWT